MALTKHQKLARAMNAMLHNLDVFHEKVAQQSKVLQLHFYEKYLIVGRPLMTEQAVAAMMYTHRLGLGMFSPNRDAREAAKSAPLIGMILTPPLYLKSQVLYCSNANESTLWLIPWGVKTVLPSENLEKLKENKLEDVLYGAAENEMSESIDWFEKEDKAGSFINQLLSIRQCCHEIASRKNNLPQPCCSLYKQSVITFHGKASLRHASSAVLDRQTYGKFLYYFTNRFIENPLQNQVDGEIALLLRIMIYAARDLKKAVSIKRLIALTTKHVSDRLIITEGGEIELSCGVADLISAYTGGGDLQRQQKLFPSLTVDKLEDHFRRASKVILPPNSIPALPEAFLIFPHRDKDHRMEPRERRRQLQTPLNIIHDPISRKELQRQLIKAIKKLP